MSEASIQECEDCISPAEAFGVVANETRLAILEELWNADERPVRFSELRRAVGMRDSAQFNYHLDKLTGQFVRKTEEGYGFRHAGKNVVRAVLSGTFNEDPRIDPFEIDGTCAHCGATLQASYGDEQLAIECPACGHGHGEYAFPPGGLADRTREEVLWAFNERVKHLHCLAADGVCPACNGRMETTIERDEDCCLGVDVRAEHVCQRCENRVCSAVGLHLLEHSEVIGFHREHGTELSDEPYWTLAWCVSGRYTHVEATDPWRVVVRMPAGDEELRVTLDGDLDVLSTERVDRTGGTVDSEAGA